MANNPKSRVKMIKQWASGVGIFAMMVSSFAFADQGGQGGQGGQGQQPPTTPEPATMMLVTTGLLGVGATGYFLKRKKSD